GSTVGDIGDSELTDRKILGEEGFISIVVVVNFHDDSIVSGPDIHARGFAEDDSVFDGIRTELVQVIVRAMAEGVEDTYQLQQVVRRTIGRWVNNNYRRRPMILPIVVAT
ncbi:MAG: RNase J family beta-CASP ribonuclease, partial [Propionibacteriaceae bacterium]|nr:RNase J family beta-CASP ribonuclease [Propionibacteriaceae bacterium]